MSAIAIRRNVCIVRWSTKDGVLTDSKPYDSFEDAWNEREELLLAGLDVKIEPYTAEDSKD
ncbi:MAG: hypothetical protein OEV59_09920 [Deltaproteobacteria bacterium]|nr:hypothetical protein [Deltaproteobacteria bacterium]